jgi:hypothetical protein
MKRIVKLTENDLTRIVKRVIKEQRMNVPRRLKQDSEDGILELNDQTILLDGASEETVNEVLSNLSGNERFIVIQNSEYADFSGVNICGLPELLFMNLEGTPNNFEEQGYECGEQMKEYLYYFEN